MNGIEFTAKRTHLPGEPSLRIFQPGLFCCGSINDQPMKNQKRIISIASKGFTSKIIFLTDVLSSLH
jgi:hypothetical protein